MKLQANLLLLLTSVIWGFGFVAQDEAMKYLDPYSFNVFRFLLGALSLIPLVYFLGRKKTEQPKAGKAFWKGPKRKSQKLKDQGQATKDRDQ